MMSSSTATPTPIDTPQNRVRHEWYQTDTQVVVSIFIKNAPKDTTSVHITDVALSVSVPLPTGSEYTLELDLSHKVDPALSRHKVLGTKIEISLAKVDAGVKWTVLEGDDPLAAPVLASTTAAAVPTPAAAKAKSYPSSSKSGPKDWDKVAKEVTKEDEKPEGDAALMKLFQDIYKNADENTRKAMIKSYTESNGTALSTSWDEVGKGKVETKPPEGMEAKSYMQ